MNIPVTATVLIDTIPAASAIESLLGPNVLRPPTPGIYASRSATPFLKAGEYYYKIDDINGNTPIKGIEDVHGDIFNQKGDLVHIAKKKMELSMHPTVPAQGMKIVYAYVDMLVTLATHEWTKETLSLSDTFDQFIEPKIHADDKFKIYQTMIDQMKDIKHIVLDFIGSNGWIMHLMRFKGTDIVIEKTIDYRIYQWSVEHNRPIEDTYNDAGDRLISAPKK